MTELPRSVLRETTPEVIRQAATLLRTARSASLAALEPQSGWPIASRIGLTTDLDGTPVTLVSALAAHTAALAADARCGLLVGLPGKGDPLAHPRLSLTCSATIVERGTADHDHLAGRYLRHQPKAGLYLELPDFRFVRLVPETVAFNAGFGRAFVMEPGDLIDDGEVNGDLRTLEAGAIDHMNADHGDAVALIAVHLAGGPAGSWGLVGIDAAGIDLAAGDELRRAWFSRPLASSGELRGVLVAMAIDARAIASART